MEYLDSQGSSWLYLYLDCSSVRGPMWVSVSISGKWGNSGLAYVIRFFGWFFFLNLKKIFGCVKSSLLREGFL